MQIDSIDCYEATNGPAPSHWSSHAHPVLGFGDISQPTNCNKITNSLILLEWSQPCKLQQGKREGKNTFQFNYLFNFSLLLFQSGFWFYTFCNASGTS